MNLDTVNPILSKYIKENFSPTDEEKKFIKTEYEKIQNYLWWRTFRIWSYARLTAVTKVKDLDIMCVDQNGGSLKENVTELLDSLVKLYGKDNVKQQDHSIQVVFPNSDIKFDVVPALETSQRNYDKSDKLFLLPTLTRVTPAYITKHANIINEWYILTDPKWYIHDCILVDDASHGIFRKAVKFCKKYKNKQKNTSELFILKSFHIEQIIYKITKKILDSKQAISLFNIIQAFFQEAPNYIINWPLIIDRAYVDQKDIRYIDAYILDKSWEEKDYTVRALDKAHKIFASLLYIKDEDDAIWIIEDLTKSSTSATSIKPPIIEQNIKAGFTSKPYLYAKISL